MPDPRSAVDRACALDLCGHWRDELATLETNLKALEAQARSPADRGSGTAVRAPRVEVPVTVDNDRTTVAAAGEPLRIVARATAASGLRSLRLRYRHVTQYEDYLTLDMRPTGRPDEYEATIPADFVIPQWDLMYFIEAIDRAGNGAHLPDFQREAPYVFVHLRR